MKLKIDFYAGGFRSVVFEVHDDMDKLPRCECKRRYVGMIPECARCQFTDDLVSKALLERGIKDSPTIITCKKI